MQPLDTIPGVVLPPDTKGARKCPKNRTKPSPGIAFHKSTGKGYVKLNGKRHYPGEYDLPETKQKYFQIVAEWESNGRQLSSPDNDARILGLISLYWECAKSYYRKPDGSPTSQIERIRGFYAP